MATPNTRRVTVDLDRPRDVQLDMNAFCTAEDLTGKNFMRSETLRDLSWRDLRALLFAGLESAAEAKGEKFDLSLSQVGALMQMEKIEQVMSALTDAFSTAMPEEQEAAKEGADPLPAPAETPQPTYLRG